MLVSVNYVSPSGFKLGFWIANLRTYKRFGSNSKSITPQKVKLLEDIGMVWDVADRIWECYYDALVNYKNKCGDLSVPTNYVTEDGIRLGEWIFSIKKSYHQKRTKGEKLSYS